MKLSCQRPPQNQLRLRHSNAKTNANSDAEAHTQTDSEGDTNPKPKRNQPRSRRQRKRLWPSPPRPTPNTKSQTDSEKSDEKDDEADAEAVKKEIAKAALARAKADEGDSTEKPPKAVAANPGTGKGLRPAQADMPAARAANPSSDGYGSMLHDRFYSEWVQPTTAVPFGAKLAVLVKLRIEKDGRVSSFEIVKPSNNVIVDESVAAIAKRVTQVDPLPAGLGNGDHYTVRINFELNSEQ